MDGARPRRRRRAVQPDRQSPRPEPRAGELRHDRRLPDRGRRRLLADGQFRDDRPVFRLRPGAAEGRLRPDRRDCGAATTAAAPGRRSIPPMRASKSMATMARSASYRPARGGRARRRRRCALGRDGQHAPALRRWRPDLVAGRRASRPRPARLRQRRQGLRPRRRFCRVRAGPDAHAPPFTDTAMGFDDGAPIFYGGASERPVRLRRRRAWRKTGSRRATCARWTRACATGSVAYASYRGSTFGVARTSDAGATWEMGWQESRNRPANVDNGWVSERFGPGWGESPLALAVSPTDPARAWGTDMGRTLSTIDSGKTWTPRIHASSRTDPTPAPVWT